MKHARTAFGLFGFLLIAAAVGGTVMGPWAAVATTESYPTAYSQAPVKTKNLEESEKAIKHQEGKLAFSEQIKGQERPDGLGRRLPPGVSRDAILRNFLTPEELRTYQNAVEYVGAVKWDQVPEHYVAVISVKDVKPFYYLGVFRFPSNEGSAKIAPVARSERFTPTYDECDYLSDESDYWFLVEGPVLGRPNEVQQLVRFDLAPYKVTKDNFAFGVRSAASEGYAGGFGYSETLHLFQIKGRAIQRILSHLVYNMKNLAGAWNEDGTRQHYVYETKFILVVDNRVTDGYFDLVIKRITGARQSIRKRWDKVTQSYRTVASAQGRQNNAVSPSGIEAYSAGAVL